MMISYGIKRRTAGIAVVTVTAVLGGAVTAQADFSISRAGVAATGPGGLFSRQAGAHPDLRTVIEFGDQSSNAPDGNPKTVVVDLPPGMSGDPTAAPACAAKLLGGNSPDCPTETQVGVATVSFGPNSTVPAPVFNMERGPDSPGRFGMNILAVPVFIDAKVRPGDNGISAVSANISQAKTFRAIDLTLWGVPADPSHNAQRIGDPNVLYPPYDGSVPSTAPRLPFLTNATSCSDTPATTTISADSWQRPGVFSTVSLTSDLDGTPFVTEGCDKLAFDPTIDVRPLSHTADAPTGLAVDLSIPQNDAPDGLATAHLRRVAVTLPKGMSVSPSSAAGLGACAPSQINLGSDAPVSCPSSSKLGTVEIDTPVLDNPLFGDVILAKQDDNPFRSLLALYIVAKGPGFTLKLAGKVDADPETGQLTTTFDNNPQLPFSDLHLRFRGGPQAPLATPPTCGTYTTHAELVSWASDKVVRRDTPMVIDEGCEPRTFAPSFTAGSINPAAGADSPFTLTVTRPARTQYLNRISTTLPAGLLARIASAPQCPDDQADAGTCASESDVGSVAVLSGPGAEPLPLTGRVFLTGPYRGAPFGLSIVVPTAGQAGPFDLGNVVVRAAISVDRTDAHAIIESDPLPTIIQGIPLRMRQVSVTIDRPGFMFNPTSCAATSIVAGLGSLEGETTTATARFQPLGCSDLGFAQKLALRFTGKATTDGTHPGIVAKLTTTPGGANIKKAVVKLPLSVALDPNNAQALCTPAERDALACPAASIVGTASAVSILPHPLTGPVYFVQGLRKTQSGATVRTLPKLWIPLSADGVTIDINASSGVDKLNRLVTTFDNLPDAPISQFDLSITGGKHGIIVVSGKPGTCDRDKTIDSQFTGQNLKVVDSGTPAKVEGCKPKLKKASATSRAVTLRLSGLSAGKLTITGNGVAKATRTVRDATEAAIVGRLTASARRTLRHKGRMKVTVSVRFAPKTGKATTVRKALTVRR
jgi:hypothetical protein